MLTTNNILDPTTDLSHLNIQQQQQQHQHQHQQHHHYHHQSHKMSSSSVNTLPSYNLFNSLSLFSTEITPSNQGLINDFGSSSTQSPKEEYLDDCFSKLSDNMEIMSNDNVMFQFKEAMDTIQLLNQKINILSDDLLKKQQIIHGLQSTIALKDLEIQKQSKIVATMNQVYDSQSRGQIQLPSERFSLPINENADIKFKNNAILLDNEPSTSYSDNMNKWNRWTDETSKQIEKKRIDYDTMVNKILQNNDQQSSIFLQQKLKNCSIEHKQVIFESIQHEAFGLMTNRFGNFLVQRIFELGTPDQIRLLAQTMKGRVLTLTCEPFGCHVVQKALDSVDEKTKAMLVTELFQNIPDTILHKSACHVWQKVFEIRWVHYPVNIMSHMYEALKGKWTQVALDETGSLVIQNIFENLPEPDKRPVINEILDNMFIIARGQWGNWVIQHILEQAEHSKDREMAFDMVLHRGIQLSMDQFASKVVEKALSIGGPCYMSKFIHHISTSSRSQRPRIALIDIASDQYGNYVVQWIINNAPENHKIDVCKLIKKHMVSLRGSKYGQRVAFLVEKCLKNHEINTYPVTS